MGGSRSDQWPRGGSSDDIDSRKIWDTESTGFVPLLATGQGFQNKSEVSPHVSVRVYVFKCQGGMTFFGCKAAES